LKVALYIFPNFLSHLNPTSNLSKQLMLDGWDIVYCGRQAMFTFTAKMQFKLHPLQTYPFIYHLAKIDQQTQLKKRISRANFRQNNVWFEERKSELQKLISKFNPEIIFLDPFCYSDFILIYSINPLIRCIFLNVRFPSSSHSRLIPPSNIFAFPGKWSKILWQKHLVRRLFNATWKRVIYLGKTDNNFFSEKFKELRIPKKFSVIKKNLYSPLFQNIEEWFLFPKEIDFPDQKLFPWQKYIPLGFDTTRFEFISEDLKTFIEKKERINNSKLIYCSLGGLTDIHLSLNKKIDSLDLFYQKLIDIAISETKFYFIIALGQGKKATIKNMPGNVYIADGIPQKFVLKNTDLMINHGGGSINEAAYSGVPMLVFPINDVWDFNGNAARVVYHGLGLKASLTNTTENINLLIKRVIYGVKFQENAKQKATDLAISANSFNINQYITGIK
jgi:zeaxanthin glucosyltransferase